MSSDFYFRKWNQILIDLEALLSLDLHLQETKAHDKKRCDAARRLSGILARYMVIYNNVWECLHQTLQVQKPNYIQGILKAVVSRILEIKHELQKLEVSEYHFTSHGLIDHKLTHDDTQLAEIPDIDERPQNIQNVLQDIFEQVKERKRQMEEDAARAANECPEEETHWWDEDASDIKNKEDQYDTDEKKVELTKEQLEFKRNVELIQAQERTRKVIAENIQKRNKRIKWEKELNGTLAPPIRYEIREKAAEVIQNVCRKFFELKRQKLLQCKRNELLGMNYCLKPKSLQKEKLEQIKIYRAQLRRKYHEQWKVDYENRKQEFLKRRSDEIREDYRNYIRDWFKTWYETILFFHDIPSSKKGGAVLIIKDDLPTPEEWLEQYQAYLAEKKANKGKTDLDKKIAKLEAKRVEIEQKKAEHIKQKMEAQLHRKMMKNPSLHPGFDFPKSKKMDHILEALHSYYKDWGELDAMETWDVKEKYVHSVDMSNIYMEAKIEIVATVEEDMRKELKQLQKALKTDYEISGEKMPEPMKEKRIKAKKKKKVQKTLSVNIIDKLEDLVFRGYVREYPKTKIDEFIGDPNFCGDDLRCNYVAAYPYNGEIRSLWWDKCRQLSHGSHRLLLVGPRSCGKTTLVHILASMNDAVLFELNPRSIYGLLENTPYLDHLMQSIASCARAVQPSVIHIKHVHRMFYRKVPPHDADVDWNLVRSYFKKKIFKCIHKTDKVTIIGTCVYPWVARSAELLKLFPTVELMPNTSYGTVAHILKDWVLRHTVIPADFQTSCLTQVLIGFSYGYLQSVLERFMTAETIARIAARGLSPMDVYDFIITDATEGKDGDYEKYLKWYYDKTACGQKEQKQIEAQLSFKRALAEYAENMEKHKKSKANTHNL